MTALALGWALSALQAERRFVFRASLLGVAILLSAFGYTARGETGDGAESSAESAAAERGAVPRSPSTADAPLRRQQPRTLADHRVSWPTWEHFVRVVTLRDYNTRVVLLGTTLLGVCGGVTGVFMLLRKRSLVGDVVSHAALPGIGVAFLVLEAASPGAGRSLPGLLGGAVVAGLLGASCAVAIRRATRIKEDAALAIVLSIFFGLGIVLFTAIQSLPTGNAAGLNQFIFGKAASIVADDVWLIAAAGAAVLVVCGLLFKEFGLLSFDEGFAAAQGWPTTLLDLLLMGLVVGVTVIGMQSVGLLLVVAMLITPAAAARFWSDRLGRMTLAAGVLGGLGAIGGVLLSALFPRLAAGAVIVLVGAAFFGISLVCGARRGLLWRFAAQRRLQRRVARQHLLRAMFECADEDSGDRVPGPGELAERPVAFERLLAMRSWTPRQLRRDLELAHRDALVEADPAGGYRLTAEGAEDAARMTRNHRLWEIYLIHYADVAASRVDRDADRIEHVLEAELIAELERLLAEQHLPAAVPPSPHALAG